MPTKARNTRPKRLSQEKSDRKREGKRPSAQRSSAMGRKASLDYVYSRLKETHGSLDDLECRDALDLLLFSHLLMILPLAESLRAFRQFKTQFVDWNEVRISTAKEVQDILRESEESLESAILIKEFLNRLFTEHHHLGLEFLKEKSISEIRSFFKKPPGINESTVNLLLEHLKEYPVVPLESWMHPCLERLGWASPTTTPLQRQKDLFEQASRERVLALYAYLAEHARAVCVTDPTQMDCPHCVLKRGCPHPNKVTARKNSANGSSSTPR